MVTKNKRAGSVTPLAPTQPVIVYSQPEKKQESTFLRNLGLIGMGGIIGATSSKLWHEYNQYKNGTIPAPTLSVPNQNDSDGNSEINIYVSPPSSPAKSDEYTGPVEKRPGYFSLFNGLIRGYPGYPPEKQQ